MTESKTKKCEICGERKPIADFSKSYRKRCKACVAKHTRQARAEEKKDAESALPKDDRPFRKAIVKDTGETVMVRMCREPLNVRMALYETEEGRKFPMFALEYEKEIDWEQRRYDLIRDFYLKWTGIDDFKNDAVLELRFNEAIQTADALINKLKTQKYDDRRI